MHSERATRLVLLFYPYRGLGARTAVAPRRQSVVAPIEREKRSKEGLEDLHGPTVRAPLNIFPDWKGLGMLDDAVGRTRGVTYLSYEFFYICCI